MRVLLVAPFVGEIGWELLSWQGRVRWLFRQGGFERLVVLGGAGKAAFYADMPLDYREVDLSPLPGSTYEDRRLLEGSREAVTAEAVRLVVAGPVAEAASAHTAAGDEVTTLWPAYAGQLWSCEPHTQAFVRYQRPAREAVPPPCVVMVRRARSFRAGDNWPAERWGEVEGRLQRRGIHTRLYPNEAEAAIEALSACDLAIGQSTGGMHLASLCGCPHVVWSPNADRARSAWEMTDRQRYQTLWNPLGTPARVHACVDQPTVDQVEQWTLRALEAIGRRTGSAAVHAGFHCVWRARRWIDERVVRTPSFRRWPWPVQRFIRYGLV